MKRLTPLFLLAILTLALPAWADSHTFTISATDFARPGQVEVGDRRLIASITVPAGLVGLTCQARAVTINGESVHVNNFVDLETNGDDIIITGTEDEANGVHQSDLTVTLGETMQLFNNIGARALGELPPGTSVDIEVTITCQTTDITTTTSTTTSSSTTSTTPPSTTIPPSTSTTTGPPTTSTSSTTIPVTSTTVPTDSSTSIPPVSSPPTLPFTGPEDLAPLGMAAVALFALGGGLLVAAKTGRHEG